MTHTLTSVPATISSPDVFRLKKTLVDEGCITTAGLAAPIGHCSPKPACGNTANMLKLEKAGRSVLLSHSDRLSDTSSRVCEPHTIREAYA